ncbi:MAG: chromosome segregation protein SMC [Desulfuromonas sp.]|nr:chromosome segregation protein SMC [Desulfuromonas sp.]
MKIRRIEIIGFKSFVDKTVLNFEDGVTAILGPNGCGKSNVIDAVRWGMGEQNAKNLRGQAMEDVIFGGSEQRRAHGMAEVTMTFVNRSGSLTSPLNAYSEIMVTRRLYRNGDSEYLLNKAPCRLKDIAELFMDTGVGARAYSIIEQGKIGQILHARPEERRVLIEEVAGVTKYKARKRAALSKIESTRQNLIRLNDVIAEVQQQLDGLRRQANKAQRFRKLRQDIKELELALAYGQWCQLQQQAQQREDDFRQGGSKQVSAEAAVARQELQLEKLRLQQGEADAAAARTQRQVYQWSNDLNQVENELALGQQQYRNMDEQIAQINTELEQLQEADQQHGAGIQQLTQSQKELEKRLQHAHNQHGVAKDNLAEVTKIEQDLIGQLERLRAQSRTVGGDQIRQQAQVDGAVKQLELLQQRKLRHESERAMVVQRQQDLVQQQQRNSQQLQQSQQAYAQITQQIGDVRQRIEQLQAQIATLRPEVNRRQQQHDRNESLLATLQELATSREGYAEGVRQLLSQPQTAQLFMGVIADGIRVQVGYEQAVAAAIGECLYGLCVQSAENITSAETALSKDLRCVYQLRYHAAGFHPHQLGGRATALLDLIDLEEKFRPFISSLLCGCYCVDSLTEYLADPLPVGVVLVTAAGSRLDWRGTLSRGGGDAIKQQLQNKRRLDELREQCAASQLQAEQAQQQLEEQLQLSSAAKDQCHQLELQQHQHQSRSAELERDKLRLVKDLQHWQERAELLTFEAGQWDEEASVLEGQKALATDTVMALQQQQQELVLAEQELAAKSQQQQQLCALRQQELHQLRIDIAKMKEQEKALAHDLQREQQLAQQEQARQVRQGELLTSLSAQQQEITQQRRDLDLRRQVLLEHCQQEKQLLQELQHKAELAAEKVAQCELSLKQQRDRLRCVSDDQSKLQLAWQEVCLERDHLRQSILERYRLDLAAPLQEESAVGEIAALPQDVGKAEARLEKLRAQFNDFGEVNLMAIEEFAALEERFNFLTGQRADLTSSIEDLQTAINQINRTSRRRFKEAFEQVNAKFTEVFPRLFVGGHAELTLTDAADLLDSGVEISAQPPGKKLQNVGLLSGGEKALTAVALIFAIFMIKPSPFCILDEVDAPLDDANIGRFNEMVQEMAAASQFIIITHNTRTMEIADTLFGVTMETPGVSSLVAVRMGDLLH